jgi:hypothetical protein
MTDGKRLVFRQRLFCSLAFIALAGAGLVGCQMHKVTSTNVANSKSMMRKLYEEDQSNRNDTDGDARRRRQVQQLIRDGKFQSAEDYYYAAFIFQHGQRPSDFLYAHVLAVTAVDKGLHSAMWLSAATLDRYLHSGGHPQVFGTQFGNLSIWNVPDASGDDQEPYDREMVSDTIRAMWCVKSESAQAKILADKRAGKGFVSTRTCPLPGAQFDTK